MSSVIILSLCVVGCVSAEWACILAILYGRQLD